MAKRSRKSSGKKSRQKTTAQPQQPASVKPVAKSNGNASAAQTTIDFVKDYYYVYDDMRVMLILTVVMVLLMLGLSFVF